MNKLKKIALLASLLLGASAFVYGSDEKTDPSYLIEKSISEHRRGDHVHEDGYPEVGLGFENEEYSDHESGEHEDYGEIEHEDHGEVEHEDHEEGEHDDHKEGANKDHGEIEHKDHEEGGHEDHDKESGDDGHGHDNEGHDKGVELSASQIRLANIRVETLNPRAMKYQVYAPGEIKANGYTSYLVSPRVDSVVLRRHVALGDHVEEGQPLVTLFSEAVAEAQAAYRVSNAEWRRVTKLGRKAVGDNRYIAAQAAYEASLGRLLAFGLSTKAIERLSARTQTFGEYTLLAATEGVVLTDDFRQGQRVEAGVSLIELADEHELWVEARLAPSTTLALPAGSGAKIKVGNNFYDAEVIQNAHTIDSGTRTRVVRLMVNNHSHRLHPGMFADVFFQFSTNQPVMAVPETALMRSADGDWMVFVEVQPGKFKGEEVSLGRTLGQWREIQGIKQGARIVFEGAFFVASQIAKGGFDPHNH